MTKFNTQTIPASLEILYSSSLVNRSVRTIDNSGRKVFQDSNKNIDFLDSQSLAKEIGNSWNGLSDVEKNSWSAANTAGFCYSSGYQLFYADYSFRKLSGLSVPGSPSSLHQLFCLYTATRLRTPARITYTQYDNPLGSIDVNFNYQFKLVNPADTATFRVALGFYRSGYSWQTVEKYYSLTGSSWSSVSDSFIPDSPSREFRRIEFWVEGDPADLYIDNLSLANSFGYSFFENFNPHPLNYAISKEDRCKDINNLPNFWSWYGSWTWDDNDVYYYDLLP